MTVSQENIAYFQIERRHESQQEYTVMGKLLANEISSGYDVSDYDIEADGVYYYRLTSVDNEGNNQISDEIGIDVTAYRAQGVSIYPNPAISDVNVELTLGVSKLVKLDLYNTQGVLVKANLFNGQMDQGTTNINLNVSDIPAGVYNLVVDMGDKTLSKRLILLSN